MQVAILVLSPTRELTAQIAKEAKLVCKFHPGLDVTVMMGGTNADKEKKVMQSGGAGEYTACTAHRMRAVMERAY